MGKNKKKKRNRDQSNANNYGQESKPQTALTENQEKRNDFKEEPTGRGNTTSGSKNEKPMMNRFLAFLGQAKFTDWCMVVFTFVLAITSIHQGCVINDQLKSQRPFIVPVPSIVNDWRKDDQNDFQVSMAFVNQSSLPAMRVVASRPKVAITQNLEDAKGCAPDYGDNRSFFFNMLPPAPQAFQPALNIAQAVTQRSDAIRDKQRIEKGIDRMIVYGGVRYSDLTGTGDFETQYCIRYNPTGSPFGPCGTGVCDTVR